MRASAALRETSRIWYNRSVDEPRTLRPIEALAESGSLLNRRIWLVLLPIGLELLIWLAPRVILGAELLPLTEGTPTSLEEGAGSEGGTMLTFIRDSNLLSLILGIWVPSLGISAAGAEANATVVLESFPQLLFAFALLLPVSFLLGSAYLALIASEVQQRTLTWEILVPRVVRLAIRLAGLVGIILAVTVIPFTVASLLLAFIPFLGSLLFLLSIAVLLWLAFYVFFIVNSVALVRQSLPRVIRLSLNLIHSNPWSFVGFFFLYWLIVFGTSIIWNVFIDLAILNIGIGRIIATVGNAYVGTWVTIAMFMYVWNRLLVFHGEPTTP